jgi:hypothetical protein
MWRVVVSETFREKFPKSTLALQLIDRRASERCARTPVIPGDLT